MGLFKNLFSSKTDIFSKTQLKIDGTIIKDLKSSWLEEFQLIGS